MSLAHHDYCLFQVLSIHWSGCWGAPPSYTKLYKIMLFVLAGLLYFKPKAHVHIIINTKKLRVITYPAGIYWWVDRYMERLEPLSLLNSSFVHILCCLNIYVINHGEIFCCLRALVICFGKQGLPRQLYPKVYLDKWPLLTCIVSQGLHEGSWMY